MYSRFNDCETSLSRAPRIFLVAEEAVKQRVPFRLEARPYRAGDPERPSTKELRVGPFVFDRISGPAQRVVSAELADPSGPEVRAVRWAIDLPASASQACISQWFDAPPGRYRFRAEFRTRGNVAARLMLNLGRERIDLFGACGQVHERIVAVETRGGIRARTCPVSALKSGHIEVLVSLHALDDAPTGFQTSGTGVEADVGPPSSPKAPLPGPNGRESPHSNP